MNNSGGDLKGLTIVLIADRSYKKGDDADISGNELEMISDEYYEDVSQGLCNICKNVVHYQSPEELIENIQKHKEDLVLTVYGGTGSRNRMALVPAICESYKIKFVGADTYARILCQDKFLSKEFARRYNINSAPGILIDRDVNLTLLKELRLPLIIKPNFEGSSIGISEKSKANTYEEAIEGIKDLLERFQQPILVEEFISGKEICLCIIGSKKEITLFQAMEVYNERDDKFLLDRIYSAWEKHVSDNVFVHRDVTRELTEDQQSSLRSLFNALGKMDFMRIDGRLNSDGFNLIELTPDAYIGRKSAIADAAAINKLSYEQLLKNIIHTALTSYHIPYSNCIKN